MARIIEVPTHLNVEDTLLFGMTARQILRLVASLSIAYGVWDQLDLPTAVRGTLAILLALLGVLLAVVQPGSRPLDQWAFAAAVYALLPRRLVWSRPQPDPSHWRVVTTAGWADLDVAVGWIQAEDGDVDDDEHSSGRRWLLRGLRSK